MNKTILLHVVLVAMTLPSLFSQPQSNGCLQLKLQFLPNQNAWAVYVTPGEGVSPSLSTITGSGQVTVITPLGFTVSGLTNHAGLWQANAVINAPAEAPDKRYISFGLVVDQPQIKYQAGQETLLFTFAANANLPDDLKLITQGDPLYTPPNSVSANAGNDLSAIDFGVSPFEFYYYCCNMLPNGSLICNDTTTVDPGGNGGNGGAGGDPVDTFGIVQENCLRLKLEPIPGTTKWGVYVKPGEDILPTGNTVTGSGQVTILAPLGFTASGLTNHAGTWQVNAVITSPAETPDKRYISFGLLNDLPKIEYVAGEETLLFSFSGNNQAGVELALIEYDDPMFTPPNSMSANAGNDLTAYDFGLAPSEFYQYCCNYFPDGSLSCGSVAIDTTGNVDTTGNIDTTGTVDTTGNIDTTGTDPEDTTATTGTLDLAGKKTWLTVSPNPASDWLTVHFEQAIPEGQGSMRIFGAQGTAFGRWETGAANSLRLDLKALPPGTYLLALEMEGRVLQRERVVVF